MPKKLALSTDQDVSLEASLNTPEALTNTADTLERSLRSLGHISNVPPPLLSTNTLCSAASEADATLVVVTHSAAIASHLSHTWRLASGALTRAA